MRFTCDPDKLANYFGANPDAPHYLTPVFFTPDVFKRYYDDPELFSVSDGRLSCGNLWGVQIDNGNPNVVSVFLGDLGRDLPTDQRDHWRAHNIPPVAEMSVSSIRRSFYGLFADSANPEHLFKNAYAAIQSSWLQAFGWRLYRESTGRDANIMNRLHIPLDETDSEFEAQLLNLTMLLVDLLNESELTRDMASVPNEKGISKLMRFLEAQRYEYVDRDIALLRRLQNLRSRTAAHSTGSQGEAILKTELNSQSRREYFKHVMRDATQMLVDLSKLRPGNTHLQDQPSE